MLFNYTGLLKLWSRGVSVKYLQEVLTSMGYNTFGVDGVFGPNTEAAVRKFQTDNKLVVDGLVGRTTARYINANLRNIELANPTKPSFYSKRKMFGSTVHVIEVDQKSYHVDVDLGIRGKSEKVSTIVKSKQAAGLKIVAGINAGFFVFNSTKEHLGLYIDDGLYYSPPSPNFVDFIYYKDGTTELVNLMGYDQKRLSDLQAKAHWAIGTSYSLVQNGRINLENATKFDHYKYRHPRTLMGVKANGSFLLVTVDGRTSGNLGVTAQQSAEIMMSLGAVQAFNLDGGGSTTMVIVENGVARVKNTPSNNGRVERSVGSVMLVYEK